MQTLPQHYALSEQDIYRLNLILKHSGIKGQIYDSHMLTGGCINRSYCLFLDNGIRYFLKIQTQPYPDLFEKEAIGLNHLRASSFHIPKVILYYHQNEVILIQSPQKHFFIDESYWTLPSFILMEFIEAIPMDGHLERMNLVFRHFGTQLANLHKIKHSHFGFKCSSYLGTQLQCNQWESSWRVFFVENRLQYQINLLKSKGLWDNPLEVKWKQSLKKINSALDCLEEKPSLVHGDLWKHNFLVDIHYNIYLFDPAVYYANREVDIAMTCLFGGFSNAFYESYEKAYPLEARYKERFLMYHLYHFLNYMNSFGSDYRQTIYNLLCQIEVL